MNITYTDNTLRIEQTQVDDSTAAVNQIASVVKDFDAAMSTEPEPVQAVATHAVTYDYATSSYTVTFTYDGVRFAVPIQEADLMKYKVN